MFKPEAANNFPPGEKPSDDEQGFIRLRNLVKSFKTGAGEVTVLKGINLDFNKGEFVGVIGKSGSGKSTLINMITGIDHPSSGEVFIGGTALHLLNENQMAAWRGRNLGIVFQFFQLLPMLTLLENIMLPMDFCNMYSMRERRERAMELLRLVEMEDQADKLPSAISGGQQQRVAIARALANDPPIIIADEPTGNLDSHTAEAIFEMFEQMASQGKTIVMVTHDSALARRVNRTVLIYDGEIVNEWVYKALPTLNADDMLKATKNLKPLTFPAHAPIITQDEATDHFYIITSGVVEIALKRPFGNDVVVTRMESGQFFGEIELIKGHTAIATVRAAEMPVEVVVLERPTFLELMSRSESTRNAIQSIVDQRVDENVSARKE